MVYPYPAHEVRNASETVQRNRQKYSFSMVFDETEPQTTFHKGSRHIYKYLKLHTPKGLRSGITDACGGTVHFGTCDLFSFSRSETVNTKG